MRGRTNPEPLSVSGFSAAGVSSSCVEAERSVPKEAQSVTFLLRARLVFMASRLPVCIGSINGPKKAAANPRKGRLPLAVACRCELDAFAFNVVVVSAKMPRDGGFTDANELLVIFISRWAVHHSHLLYVALARAVRI